MKIKTLLKNWQDQKKNYEKQNESFEKKISLKRKQLERLEKRKDQLKYPHWIEHVLKPLGFEIEKKLLDYKFNDNLLTFGLGCECPLMFKKENEKSLMITFRPISEGLEIIDYSKKDDSVSPKSIAYMNGFQYKGTEFNENTTIDWLIEFMKKKD